MSEIETKKTVAEENAANPKANKIRALLVERHGLEQRGLKDRIKQVDAELDRLGYKPDRSEKRSRARIAEDLAAAALDQRDNPQVQSGAGDDENDPEEVARLAEIEERAAADRKAAAEQRAQEAEDKGATRRTAKPRARRGRGSQTQTG